MCAFPSEIKAMFPCSKRQITLPKDIHKIQRLKIVCAIENEAPFEPEKLCAAKVYIS